MNATDQLFRLLAYDMWANKQLLLSLQEHPNFTGSKQAIAYYSHIAGTQELWYQRIKGKPIEDLDIWHDYGLTKALQKLKTYSEKWQLLLKANRSAIDRTISYQNSKDITYKTALSDILHHIIIHGQHHRAQISWLLRDAGIAPPSTDFIYYSRIK